MGPKESTVYTVRAKCALGFSNQILHRPNEDFNIQRFFMKMKIEDEKSLFFSSSNI